MCVNLLLRIVKSFRTYRLRKEDDDERGKKMCGLVGIVKFNNECVDPVLLKKMTNIISYRGPDDVGHVLLRPVSNGQRSKVIEYKDPGEVSVEDISGYKSAFSKTLFLLSGSFIPLTTHSRTKKPVNA